MARINNIVLVHGAFVDGSSWAGLYDILKEDGFDVSVVQNPTISLEGDVAATNLILDEQVGPAVLVGHSYGGVVITEAGRHPKVAALVYIAAFAPDKGESAKTIVGCLAPSSSESEVTSATGKALFHLRFRKLPMAAGIDVEWAFRCLHHFQQREPRRQFT
jgi:pimeloyl-ACP methyl ester carboxylesterase